VVKLSTSARSPLSPTLWPADAFLWWRSLALGLLLVAVVLAATVGALVLLLALNAVPRTAPAALAITWPIVVAQLVTYVPEIAVLTLLLPPLARRPLSALGVRPPRSSDLIWAAGGAALMVGAAAIVSGAQEGLFHLKADEVQVQLLRGAHGSLVAGFVVLACAAAPIAEEFAFRGFLFNALLRYLPAWGAALASAIVFGCAHYQPGNLGALAPLAGAGLVLALVYYRSGSLVASMLTHGTFNLVTVVLVLVFHQK